MFRKILTASVVAVSLAGATFATSGPAEARYGRHGAFWGGAALGLLGGALLLGPHRYGYGGGYYDNGYYGGGYGYGSPYYYGGYYRPAYYYPRRPCYLEQRFVDDYYGGHYVTVRVCY